ncbi:MAG: dihydrofolate reductase family protein [Patescibacteria group bacterium]
MQTFIIAALSADGYIARDARHASLAWTSKEDKRRFIELTKRAGVVVMGSTTYATLQRPLKERVNIVYSTSKKFEGAETTNKPPFELLAELKERGFKEVAICGGAHIYTMFMKAKVVDKLYLTIEPIIFGSGVRLFNEDLTHHLKLVACGQTEGGAILLEYDVLQSGNVE